MKNSGKMGRSFCNKNNISQDHRLKGVDFCFELETNKDNYDIMTLR